MFILTIDYIPGRDFTALGMVKGATVQSKHLGKDILSGLKGVVGGELVSYTDMMMEAREIATSRMIIEAEALKADAIIGVRYTTSSVAQGASEVLAYGTAIIYK